MYLYGYENDVRTLRCYTDIIFHLYSVSVMGVCLQHFLDSLMLLPMLRDWPEMGC